MSEADAYRAAVEKWGRAPQIHMAIEECGELIVALTHWMRNRADRNRVTTEIADVEIMMGQLREIFGSEDVDWEKRAKLKRLKERLANA